MSPDDLSKRELVNRWIVAELLAPRGQGPLARRYVAAGKRPRVPAAQPEPEGAAAGESDEGPDEEPSG